MAEHKVQAETATGCGGSFQPAQNFYQSSEKVPHSTVCIYVIHLWTVE